MLATSPQKALPRGRRQEREAITALLSRAAAGSGGALMFHGDRGIGKTALLESAAAEAAGFVVLTVTADEAESALPFGALHQLLHLMADHIPEPLRVRALALASALEDGDEDRFSLSIEVLSLFRDAARERPLLCRVDDAHWLDRPTFEVLTFMARRLAGKPIAMLFTHCDEGHHTEPVPGVPAHRLTPLDPRTSREILRALVPMEDVAGVLAAIARGNPRALVDLAGSLTPEQLRGDAPAPQTLPPDSGLRTAYRARLDRLPADARWLVLLAAADDELDVDGLVRAATAAGLDVAALEPAESAGLIRVDGMALTFPQPLVRSVAYHESTLAQRRSAHERLAQTLDPETQPLRHLHHRAAAAYGQDDLLAAQLERAATGSAGRYAAASRAFERAAKLTSDADGAAVRLIAAAHHAWHGGEPHRARMLLRLVPRCSSVPPRTHAQSEVLVGEIELRIGTITTARRKLLAAADELVAGDRHLAVGALMRAGEALCLSGGYSRYPDIARRALALRQPNEPLGVEFMFENLAALSATFRGDHSRAIGPLRRVLALAPVLDEAGTLTRASMAVILRGDGARAYRLASRAVTVARDDGDVPAIPQALEVAALSEFAMGRYDTTPTGLEGLRLARESGQENLASNYLAFLAALAAMIGDRQTCLLRLHDAATHLRIQGASRAKAFSDWALAMLDLGEKRYADVVTRLRGVMTDHSGSGHLIVQVAATPHLVEAAVRCDDRHAAIAALRVYDAWASSTASPHWLALSARCHALLARSEGEAEAYFREALGQHLLGDGEFDHARTQLLFGQHLRRHRQPAAAREFLRGALATFERFEALPWADQAGTELRAAGHHVRPRRVRVTDTLTPHQTQIARLVAEGATNREVGARLLISTRTVDHHMRNIFAKLGVRSRVELANLMS